MCWWNAVPRDAVDEVFAVCGVRERQSDAKLPAHVITYLTLGLCLVAEDDYEEVAARVTGLLDRFGCWACPAPTASATTQARKRLGRAVLPELFERTWDITKLRGPDKGVFYQLYVLIDIYSSFNPSWILSPVEDSRLAADFIAEAIERNGTTPHTVHADSKTGFCRGS